MKKSVLKRIADVLAKDDLQGDEVDSIDNIQFCVTDELTPDDINIEVGGLGVMTFPVNQQYIKKLINISSKAKFGLRDQTILDENVRNSYEIKSDKLHVTVNEESLTRMLSKMRDVMGLGENSVLTPHLHNMLIYGPGHFFDMHQDTEKLKGMVASLVVVLPSPHVGGDLIIEHGKKKHVFSSENVAQSNAKCVSFYADCIHMVEKVKDGYRIALTYNLVLNSEEICNMKNVNQQLTDAVKDYFGEEVGKQPQEVKPKKLVYFLNHSYTEHGLRMSLLKGADRANASALYGLSRKLGLILHLALVEIKQSWTTEGGYYDSDPDIGERLDHDEITLSYWLDSNSIKLPYEKLGLNEDEICWTKETDSLEPYNKEYEGYMGNWGGNMDFWYRRAAIVLWPESVQVPMSFMLNYDNALKELYLLTSSQGKEQEAMEIIAKAGRYLHRTFNTNEKSDFDMLANIALYIKDKDTALSILSHFKWETLKSDIVKMFVKLQTQYGISWCIDLLNSWKNGKSCSISDFHSFVQTFLCHEGAVSIVELLLDAEYDALVDNGKGVHTWKKVLQKLALPHRIERVYQLFAACAAIQNIPVLGKVTEHLISNPELYPVSSLAELYFKLQDTIPSEYFSNFKLLKSYVVKTIDSNVAVGMQSNDDWSIQAALPCTCEHCSIATSFLRSKSEKTKIWPIRKSIRKHIYQTFDGLDLPVDLSTDRRGSPFKMVMVKKDQLHSENKKRFDELKFLQQKL